MRKRIETACRFWKSEIRNAQAGKLRDQKGDARDLSLGRRVSIPPGYDYLGSVVPSTTALLPSSKDNARKSKTAGAPAGHPSITT